MANFIIYIYRHMLQLSSYNNRHFISIFYHISFVIFYVVTIWMTDTLTVLFLAKIRHFKYDNNCHPTCLLHACVLIHESNSIHLKSDMNVRVLCNYSEEPEITLMYTASEEYGLQNLTAESYRDLVDR